MSATLANEGAAPPTIVCTKCGHREVHPDDIEPEALQAACIRFDDRHECAPVLPIAPELIKVHVKTDPTGAAETVILEGRVIPNALVDVDLHLGRVTLTFPAKVVVF